MKFSLLSSSALLSSVLVMLSGVNAQDAGPAVAVSGGEGVRQATGMGGKVIKRRTDPPIKGEQIPPRVVSGSRVGSNIGGGTGQARTGASIPNYGFDREAFDRDWASRRGVKVDPKPQQQPKASAEQAKPKVDFRQATQEAMKNLNMDELLNSTGLKDIVKPIAEAAVKGESKENIVETLRRTSQQMMNDPVMRQKTQEVMNDPGMKKFVEQFNPQDMQKQMADLFGSAVPKADEAAGKRPAAGSNPWEDLLKDFKAPVYKNNNSNDNGNAGKKNTWEDLLNELGAGKAATPASNGSKDKVDPLAGLDDLFGDLFKPSGAGQKAAAAKPTYGYSAGKHGKAGKPSSSFISDDDYASWTDYDL